MTASSHQNQVIWTPLKRGQGDRRRYQWLALVVIPVVLIAAIAVATRGGSGTGRAPAVMGQAAGPQMSHTRQGAESTGLRIAMAFGSEAMFVPAQRDDVLRSIVEPDQLPETISKYDAQYDPFTKRLGLDSQGNPPVGGRFVSRAMPAGVTVRTFTNSTAIIDYWCQTLFGITGTQGKDIPVKTAWLTARVTLHWTDTGWRLADYTQSDGPQPSDGQFGTAPQL